MRVWPSIDCVLVLYAPLSVQAEALAVPIVSEPIVEPVAAPAPADAPQVHLVSRRIERASAMSCPSVQVEAPIVAVVSDPIIERVEVPAPAEAPQVRKLPIAP